jgi:hypothetical protein
MAAILAIEGDHNRRVLLRTLIQNRVEAHLTIVESAQAAIAYLSVCDVDVIVVPALLPPRDSEQLSSHVRLNAGRHVQMVTIPALDVLRETPPEESQGPGIFGRRRAATLGLQYDPAMVALQIADRLEHALKMRGEQRASSVGWPARGSDVPFADPVRRPASPTAGAFSGDRRFAPRMRRDDVPWLWGIRLPWGTDVELVNISTSGLLVESDSKVSSGITLELRLRGPSLNRVVLARFVRCTIAAVDRGRVRYFAAAQFEQPFDSPLSRTETMPRATPLSMAELLAAVLSDSGGTEAPSVRFARGLRELLGVRDVLIRRGPLTPVEDSDTVYFEVREGASCTVLQVMCDKHRPRTADDLKLMRAAAGLAATLLQLEPPIPLSSRPPILNWRTDTRPKNAEPI